ncbi:MAG: tRNA epoxyqueuosine(34) reductase QueG [Phycisphaerales bacterium]|nr:tRNA epoxyqueuosine(34) reductase QueG [Phycisphaerales bacterium]
MDQSSSRHLGSDLIERAKSLGFACAGISSVDPSEYRASLREWLDNEMHGTMEWMENYFDLRTDPSKLIENARSILVVGDLYASRDGNQDAPIEKGQGKIARYARGKDYHKLIKKRLMKLADDLREIHPDAMFKVFVDTAPVPERELAKRAGIGWVGKHTLIIHPKLGSYMFIGGIVMSIDVSAPESQVVITDHCGSCSACIDACPTNAITEHRVDARKCISYLTIEHRAPIEPKLEQSMGDWIYGCDICQEVCPHNSFKESSVLEATANPAYQSPRSSFDLLEVMNWSEDDRRSAFLGSAMKRAKLTMMQRNAKIVARNQGIEINDQSDS